LSRNLDKNLGVAGLFGQETLIKTLLPDKIRANLGLSEVGGACSESSGISLKNTSTAA
jgi:hypothetical protein